MRRITPKILVIFSIILSLSILPVISYAASPKAQKNAAQTSAEAVLNGESPIPQTSETTDSDEPKGRFKEKAEGQAIAETVLNDDSSTPQTFWGNVSNSTREKFTNMSNIPLPNAGNFILAGQDAGGSLNTANLVDKMDKSIGGGLVSMLKILYQVGIMIAVCVFAFMGVQFVMSSPQQKAQLKASLFPYFVGLLLFVAGVPIATFIINIFLQLL